MAQCACGNQDLVYKTGVAKGTGKKWQGFKCEPCGVMMGMNGVPWGAKPQRNVSTKQQPQSSGSLEQKIDKILAILQANFKTPLKDRTEISHEEIPDLEESPF